jgi:ABC-2 type transport system ATP-binding protein
MIEVKNLVKKYGDFTAVNGVSFDVHDGEVFAFLGPNGAGKSTTIKMLTTLLRPTSGNILLNNIDPVIHPEAARRTFGIVFQDPSVDEDLTAWENLDLHGVLYDVPELERRQRSEELLRFVDLWDRKDSQVKEFSGGMKRRLEIARAFLHQPKIIFLDEPTIGLDPQTRNLMWERIHELNKTKGTTIFFSTHLMEEADKWAARISVMDHGKIIATGSSADLKKQTNTQYLEDAFLALTGKDIREQGADTSGAMKAMRGGGRR